MEEKNKKVSETEKQEWEVNLEKLVKDSYLSGVSRGGKTFVGVIYEIILDDKKKRKNPANTVARVEAACKRLFGMNTNKSDNVVELTQNISEQEDQ